MFDIRVKAAKNMFFDRTLIKQKVDTATRKRLSKFGAYVRQTAKRSIRKRKRSSSPGQPPSSHTGLLKQFIYFGYDETRRSVVIGPVVLARKASGIPEALEHGGNVTIQWGRARGKTVTIEARPYMGPAFERELENISSLWANSIR